MLQGTGLPASRLLLATIIAVSYEVKRVGNWYILKAQSVVSPEAVEGREPRASVPGVEERWAT
jgi:hypothetical protein